MAIVKLQNGNVLLKNGKVSCSCCAPVGCCMYPAQALVGGAYTYEDLPDAINVAGVVFTKLNPPESVAGFTRYYVNPDDEYLGILDGEEESLWSYEGGGGPCLINGYNGQGGEREDQFADSYNILGVGIAIRESLCVWRYVPTSPEESIWIIEYGYPTFPYKFSVRSTVIGIYPKNGDQNTPAGTYGPGLVIS